MTGNYNNKKLTRKRAAGKKAWQNDIYKVKAAGRKL